MAVDADTLRRLAALRLAPEAMGEVLSIIADIQAKEDARKAKDRDRKRSVRGISVEIPSTIHGNGEECPPPIPALSAENPEPSRARVLCGEDISYIPPSDTTYPQTPQPLAAKKPKAEDPCKILETVLSPEIASGVVDHRRKLKKPLTALAAQGLATAFAATGHADDAARMMVERGWQGFKPKWFTEDIRGGTGPPANGHRRPLTFAEMARMPLYHSEKPYESASNAPLKVVSPDAANGSGGQSLHGGAGRHDGPILDLGSSRAE